MFLKEEDKKEEKLLRFNSLTAQEINQVFQSKNSFKNGVFIVKHNSSTEFKFLITFSKKLKLNKPQKNLLKRQVKDIICKYRKENKLKNFNLVLILIKLPQSQIYSDLKSNINSILKQF